MVITVTLKFFPALAITIGGIFVLIIVFDTLQQWRKFSVCLLHGIGASRNIVINRDMVQDQIIMPWIVNHSFQSLGIYNSSKRRELCTTNMEEDFFPIGPVRWETASILKQNNISRFFSVNIWGIRTLDYLNRMKNPLSLVTFDDISLIQRLATSFRQIAHGVVEACLISGFSLNENVNCC